MVFSMFPMSAGTQEEPRTFRPFVQEYQRKTDPPSTTTTTTTTKAPSTTPPTLGNALQFDYQAMVRRRCWQISVFILVCTAIVLPMTILEKGLSLPSLIFGQSSAPVTLPVNENTRQAHASVGEILKNPPHGYRMPGFLLRSRRNSPDPDRSPVVTPSCTGLYCEQSTNDYSKDESDNRSYSNHNETTIHNTDYHGQANDGGWRIDQSQTINQIRQTCEKDKLDEFNRGKKVGIKETEALYHHKEVGLGCTVAVFVLLFFAFGFYCWYTGKSPYLLRENDRRFGLPPKGMRRKIDARFLNLPLNPLGAAMARSDLSNPANAAPQPKAYNESSQNPPPYINQPANERFDSAEPTVRMESTDQRFARAPQAHASNAGGGYFLGSYPENRMYAGY